MQSHVTDNFRESESRGWFCALLTFTGLQYVLSIVGIALLFVYFTTVCIEITHRKNPN